MKNTTLVNNTPGPIIEINSRPARFIYGSHERQVNIRQSIFEPEFILLPIFIYRVWDRTKWKFKLSRQKKH